MAHEKCIEKYINKEKTLCDCIIDDVEELKRIRKDKKDTLSILDKLNVERKTK